MEYAAGGSLAARLAVPGARLDPPSVCRILLHALQALEYIHLKDVLHLDIKCVRREQSPCVRAPAPHPF